MREFERKLGELGGDITQTLEKLHVPATLVDRQGVILWENQAVRDRYGAHIGRPVTSVVAQDAPGHGASLLTQVVRDAEPAEFTLRVSAPEGRAELVDVSAVPVYGRGSIVGMFGVGKPRQPTTRSVAIEPHPELTKRQREVLALLAEGMSTSEIASELVISTTTVRNHVAYVLAALGVHTRLEAVITASRHGLI
jgi:DNA-binding CsgD family transcriptional regulator